MCGRAYLRFALISGWHAHGSILSSLTRLHNISLKQPFYFLTLLPYFLTLQLMIVIFLNHTFFCLCLGSLGWVYLNKTHILKIMGCVCTLEVYSNNLCKLTMNDPQKSDNYDTCYKGQFLSNCANNTKNEIGAHFF